MGYLKSQKKCECFGCESCVQACTYGALEMQEDIEGFRYPAVQNEKCIKCGKCIAACPVEYDLIKREMPMYVFGGYSLDFNTRFESTSGGAFSEIVKVYYPNEAIVFGATSNGIEVFHTSISSIEDISILRKSKYSQSKIGIVYKEVKNYLDSGKKVLFSGTPCQISGLKSFLNWKEYDNLLTVEVVCEGVPSPLYIRKCVEFCENKYASKVKSFDYRYKGKSIFSNGKWDFEVERIDFENGKSKITDRWVNPFWSIWLSHLMSRPSCYQCPFSMPERISDITLGDLWGVHIYCPELYGKNGGSSLMFANTEKGLDIVKKATQNMYGHELAFEDAIKYQGPMRRSIAMNSQRDSFMSDLAGNMDYKQINKKWTKKISPKLLFDKYIWGNRQKVFVWNLKKRVR